MSVINAGTPAEMVCEGSGWPKEHLPTTVAALLVLPAVRVYMFTMRNVKLVPSYCADETPEN